ncbi:hypothetical protein JZ751_019288 [Albula glossodonta]|uniref:Thy-1 membrane glycoprotein n=1 Tax=Albula glossodonta TaxID=121402 RepID=A0A8T2NVE4_9TELE|nr:hypothetical protein JZ751_019288 [Albula glossodonta]
MITSLFISSVVLAAFLAPGLCQTIKVCREEDGEVRVDCLIQPKPNTINTFEFSMFKGGKETVIITNVTGITADQSYKGKTRVEQLEPHGYRLTLVDVPVNENTTFTCKSSGMTDSVPLKGQMETCSAISLFLQSCPWLLSLLTLLPLMQSWSLS